MRSFQEVRTTWRRAVLAACLLAAGACRPDPGPTNVVLISIDTLRADYLGSYGSRAGTTPAIDALAAAGVRFEDVVSPVPLTLPAHSSMMTGLLPTRHGVHDNLGYALATRHTTLAELLRREGFVTGAVVSSFVLDSRFRLSQGFDSYDDDFDDTHAIGHVNERKGEETTAAALRFLRTHGGERFFLFVHYYDPHDDYAPPEPYRSRFEHDLYAGEVAYADAQVGRLVEELRELGLDETTLVIVTADHGEMLGEHGESTHGFYVYQSALRVPLVFHWPEELAPSTVGGRVGLIDIVPTVAGLLELEPLEETDGQDLSPVLRGAAPDGARREFYVESVTPNRYYGARPLFGLLTNELKYIHAPRPELYDLSRDPSESSNLVDQRARLAAGMKARLREILSDVASGEDESLADAESARRLAALGYLSGAGSPRASFDLDAEGDDPKDWIEFYGEHQRLEKLVGRGEYAEARRLAHEMLEEHPDFSAAYLQLAHMATEEGDLAAAREHYERALAIDAGDPSVHFNLGNVRAELGDYEAAVESFRSAVTLDPDFTEATERLDYLSNEAADRAPPSPAGALREASRMAASGAWTEAEEALRRALELEPDNGEAHYQLGNVLAARSRFAEAVPHFESALARAPSSPEIRYRLGLALRESGELEAALGHLQRAAEASPGSAAVASELAKTLKELGRAEPAIREYRRALELDPDLSTAWNDLGSLLGSQRRIEEAVDAFRRAVATDPSHGVAHNNLGLALRLTGRRDEALEHFRRAAELRPDWPVPLRERAWILATHPDASRRNPEEALRLAARAAELTSSRDPLVLDTLAAAQAAQGRFDEAVQTAERALARAEERSSPLAAPIRARLELYRRRQPVVEPGTPPR